MPIKISYMWWKGSKSITHSLKMIISLVCKTKLFSIFAWLYVFVLMKHIKSLFLLKLWLNITWECHLHSKFISFEKFVDKAKYLLLNSEILNLICNLKKKKLCNGYKYIYINKKYTMDIFFHYDYFSVTQKLIRKVMNHKHTFWLFSYS